MDTPSLIFYEHSLDDTQVQSLSKSVLNLGNECRAWAEENARLKAEVERLIQELKDEKSANANVEGRQQSANRNLGMENARLKAEVERLNNLIISGGAVNPDASVYTE